MADSDKAEKKKEKTVKDLKKKKIIIQEKKMVFGVSLVLKKKE